MRNGFLCLAALFFFHASTQAQGWPPYHPYSYPYASYPYAAPSAAYPYWPVVPAQYSTGPRPGYPAYTPYGGPSLPTPPPPVLDGPPPSGSTPGYATVTPEPPLAFTPPPPAPALTPPPPVSTPATPVFTSTPAPSYVVSTPVDTTGSCGPVPMACEPDCLNACFPCMPHVAAPPQPPDHHWENYCKFLDKSPNPAKVRFAADYFMWWTRKSPSEVPLLTTGSITSAIPGAFGQPGTTVLFGGNGIDLGMFPGIQAELGIWLDPCNLFSIDAGFFWTPRRGTTLVAASDAGGNPVLARPFINAASPTFDESVFLTSIPGAFSGSTTIQAVAQMFGGEINGTWHCYTNKGFHGQCFAGFRAVRLEEELRIRDIVNPLTNDLLTFEGAGNFVNPPNFLVDQDRFQTINEFYGLQFGGRLSCCHGPLTFDLYGKTALGLNDESVRIEGFTAMVAPGGTQVAAGGILAVPSNMGVFTRSRFAAVAETGFETGLAVTSWLRLKAGYSFFVMSNVVRPGSHIERVVNPLQVPSDQQFGPITGEVRPTFSFREQTFWAHRLNLGIEFRY